MASSKASSGKAKATMPGKSIGLAAVIIWIIIMMIIMGGFLCWGRTRVVSACTTKNLQLTAGQQSGAAGTIYQHMVLTNTSHRKCSLSGYPTAFLYGSDGYALGSGAAARAQPTPVNVILAPNESANTVLGYPQAGNFDPGICSATSVNLRLYPPGDMASLETALQVPWCPGFSESSMQPGS